MLAPIDQPIAYKLAFGYEVATCATTSRMSPVNEAENNCINRVIVITHTIEASQKSNIVCIISSSEQ